MPPPSSPSRTALGKLTTSNGAVAADAGAELNLSDFSSARAEIKLAEAGAEFMQTMLQFDGLVEVMRASQISEVIENALQGKPDSPYSLDEEVREFFKQLQIWAGLASCSSWVKNYCPLKNNVAEYIFMYRVALSVKDTGLESFGLDFGSSFGLVGRTTCNCHS